MPIRSINGDEEAAALVAGGELAPSSRRPTAGSSKPVILIHRPSSAAASDGLGDATEPDLGFESLGSVAVRLFAQWKLPRMQMLPVPAGEEECRDRRPNSQWEED